MTLGEIIARRRCAFTTRGNILAAARTRFLAESYENVGLREIAADVGVDVALVSRYFGSKDNLFREVLRAGSGEPLRTGVPQAELPAYLASLFVQKSQSANREHVDKLLILLRSASSPAASEIVREAFRGDVLEPLAGLLDGADATQRAAMALAILLGTTILQTVMAMEPLSTAGDEALRGRLIALFEVALSPR